MEFHSVAKCKLCLATAATKGVLGITSAPGRHCAARKRGTFQDDFNSPPPGDAVRLFSARRGGTNLSRARRNGEGGRERGLMRRNCFNRVARPDKFR